MHKRKAGKDFHVSKNLNVGRCKKTADVQMLYNFKHLNFLDAARRRIKNNYTRNMTQSFDCEFWVPTQRLFFPSITHAVLVYC